MPPKNSLNILVKDFPGFGKAYATRLGNLGITTLHDLVYYFPFRYEDLSNQKSVAETQVGETVTIQAKLWQITKIKTKTGKTMIKALVNDGNSSIDIIWFNQTYLLTVLKLNQLINFSGKVGLFGKKVTIINPKYEIINSSVAAPVHTGRLVPIYSETGGITSRFLRNKISQVLSATQDQIQEYLPKNLIAAENLLPLDQALKQIHFPESFESFLQSKKRLAFEELLLLHLRNFALFKKNAGTKSTPFVIDSKKVSNLEKSLPFTLTSSQKQAVDDILADLKKPFAMNRLLQGEVGSGKTVVSAFALQAAVNSNFQAAVMAPTEILARQHYETLQKILGKEVRIELHTSGHKSKLENFDIAVGTHALLNQVEKFTKLGLVVVDEQQRFGVVQRSLLKQIHPSPHFLTMTATPIPRTLALTIYGQLDISALDELPSGRKKVKTYVVQPIKRDGAYDFIRKEIKTGGQVFIICPLIEESESLLSVKSAKSEFEHLQKEVFPEFKLGLLHGKLSSKEKTGALENFKAKKFSILVSTPVVEVGIDIANASIMVIEAAERFGLSSLHQLRGRVGRGERQSYCLVFTENRRPEVIDRLKLLEQHDNGLKLAEMDLQRRGPGDMYGTMQHGDLGFKLANTSDLDLIVKTKTWAEKISQSKLPVEIEEELEKQISQSNQVPVD